ncbi:MAG TPA: hypothetical protein VIZ17_17290 [Acetobacteraceae bacterium]
MEAEIAVWNGQVPAPLRERPAIAGDVGVGDGYSAADAAGLRSVAGGLTPFSGELDTLVAGLACGKPSLLAWQEAGRVVASVNRQPHWFVLESRDLAITSAGSIRCGVFGRFPAALCAMVREVAEEPA